MARPSDLDCGHVAAATNPDPSDPLALATLDDDHLVAALARALGEAQASGRATFPDPAEVVAAARRLLAHWDAELYGACCTTAPAYAELRSELGDVAHVAGTLLADTLTDALTSATRLPRSVTRLMAAFVIKHGFEAGRGLACPVWERFVGDPIGDAPVSP